MSTIKPYTKVKKFPSVIKLKPWNTDHYHTFKQAEASMIVEEILPGFQIELPIEFANMETIVEIKKSASILEKKDNWDGEGSKGYTKTTLVNAINFLVRYTKWVWEEKTYAIPSPKILPGNDGGIYLYWKKPNYDLLITIPEAPNKTALFYGDDKSEELYEGKFNIEKNNPGIFLSLLQLD